MLATRNPVVCEFMRGFFLSLFDLSVKMHCCGAQLCEACASPTGATATVVQAIVAPLLRSDAACTRMPTTARPINRMIDPDCGRAIVL